MDSGAEPALILSNGPDDIGDEPAVDQETVAAWEADAGDAQGDASGGDEPCAPEEAGLGADLAVADVGPDLATAEAGLETAEAELAAPEPEAEPDEMASDTPASDTEETAEVASEPEPDSPDAVADEPVDHLSDNFIELLSDRIEQLDFSLGLVLSSVEDTQPGGAATQDLAAIQDGVSQLVQVAETQGNLPAALTDLADKQAEISTQILAVQAAIEAQAPEDQEELVTMIGSLAQSQEAMATTITTLFSELSERIDTAFQQIQTLAENGVTELGGLTRIQEMVQELSAKLSAPADAAAEDATDAPDWGRFSVEFGQSMRRHEQMQEGLAAQIDGLAQAGQGDISAAIAALDAKIDARLDAMETRFNDALQAIPGGGHSDPDAQKRTVERLQRRLDSVLQKVEALTPPSQNAA